MVAMAALLIVAAGAVFVEPGAAQEQSLTPPLVEGPAPDLDLVFTAQVVGWVEPCG